jgi:asparagine synthase (glutamine-hydrolysing)
MCGICGEWNPAGVDSERLARMNQTLVHRGPDDSGQVELGRAGLAVRRLAIIDVPGGHQPIPNEQKTAWIVFNGEIYNYRELRRMLSGRDHEFQTSADTEVILHLYEEMGERVVEQLRGMFAFAIWDARKRRLLVARDRFGQKPLFYAFDGSRLLFGSEIKAILAALPATPPLDVGSLDDFLTLRFVPSPATMFEGIRKLPPGHLLVLQAPDADAGSSGESGRPSVEVKRYWKLDYLPKKRLTETQALSELREHLFETVKSHLVSDVPLGAFLSGGMDSSLLVAVMSEIMGRPVPTFAIGVQEQDFNEIGFARQVAEHCGAELHEEVVWPDLVRLLPRMIHHLEEPSDPIAACMYHASALAARHVKVVLTGDGGDEMFAGFDRYYGFSKVRFYAALPAPLRRLLLGPLLRLMPDSAGYKNLTQKARWIHELSFHQGGRRYAEATAFFRFGAQGKAGIYGPELVRRLTDRDATQCIVAGFEAAHTDEELDRLLYADVVTRLSEHSLMLTDRMAMAQSLEGRSPFLDHQLAAYVATLPARLKIHRGRLKYIMRKLAEPLLPASILERPKQGFMFPLGYWMKGPLVPVLERMLAESALVEEGIFRREGIAGLLGEHLRDRADHHVRLWLILNLEIWHRMYVRGQSIDELGDWLAAGHSTVSHRPSRGNAVHSANRN